MKRSVYRNKYGGEAVRLLTDTGVWVTEYRAKDGIGISIHCLPVDKVDALMPGVDIRELAGGGSQNQREDLQQRLAQI